MSRKNFDLGVLFVHGIGTQQRAQTLAEWVTPLVRWLELRCEAATAAAAKRAADPSGEGAADVESGQTALDQAEWGFPDGLRQSEEAATFGEPVAYRAVLRDTQFADASDPAAPAHAALVLLAADERSRVDSDRWLLAESWWAASFSAPSFGELARWGLGVLPWIVGSHFGAQVARRFREPRPPAGWQATIGQARWMWRRAAAVGGLLVGLVVSALLLPLLAFVLILGAIPIPSLRQALLSLQLRLAAILGDSYVLLARPVESDSIVSQLRRDVRWLATRCSEVVIVAHSQGGAVAHLALRTTVPDELKLLFTFGSGLRKLEEARQLKTHGMSHANSSVITSIAFWILTLMAGIWIGAVLEGAPQRLGSVATALLLILGAGAVCVVGVWDQLRGIDLPDLRRWVGHVRGQRWRWRDYYASADPVPNGTVLEEANDVTRSVCNRSSTLSDHTTYWANLDEFVSALWDEVADARQRDPFPALRVDDATRQFIARRRRWRVLVGRTIDWASLVAALGVVKMTLPSWAGLLGWLWTRGRELLPRELGMTLADPAEYAVAWSTVGLLAVVLVPYRIVRGMWLSWDRSEMSRAIGGSTHPVSWGEGPVLTGLLGLSLLAAGLLLERFPPFWMWAPIIIGIVVLFVLEPSKIGGSSDRGPTTRVSSSESATPSKVETMVSTAMGLFAAATLPFGLGLSAWEALTWLVTHLAGGSLWEFEPDRFPSEAAGAVAVIVTACAWGVVAARRGKATKKPSGAGPDAPIGLA